MSAMPSVLIVTGDGQAPDRVWKELTAADLKVAGLLKVPGTPPGVPASDVVVLITSLQARDESPLNELGDLQRPLVVCTEPVETSTLRWAMDKGVNGVVWNQDLDTKLALTVRAVHAGQLVFPNALRKSSSIPDLTSREKQVLSLVIMGLTNREIASKLFVSESTVKSHLNTAYRKLGVGSRVEAAERITDPDEGLGTGILAITPAGHQRGRRKDS